MALRTHQPQQNFVSNPTRTRTNHATKTTNQEKSYLVHSFLFLTINYFHFSPGILTEPYTSTSNLFCDLVINPHFVVQVPTINFINQMTSIRTEEFACHVCRKIVLKKGNELEFIYRRRWSTGGGGQRELCNYEYCASHAGKPPRTDGVEVCDISLEISHTSYYNNHMNKPNVYPS